MQSFDTIVKVDKKTEEKLVQSHAKNIEASAKKSDQKSVTKPKITLEVPEEPITSPPMAVEAPKKPESLAALRQKYSNPSLFLSQKATTPAAKQSAQSCKNATANHQANKSSVAKKQQLG